MAFCPVFFCSKGIDRKARGKKAPTWRVFSLKELVSATNNFNHDNKIDETEFGSVYWGQLWNGSQIAVKRFKFWVDKANAEFAVEVEILARVWHKNLISLRGYCAEGQERLIVYDYMPNLNLFSHLHAQHHDECLLDWNKRMNIGIGLSEGISYLHHQVTPVIIHRDLKASKVLLDSNFQARISGFEFAKLINDGATHVNTIVKGSLGYLAPEYAIFGKVSTSCDVYSLGILLLELVSGKKPIEKLNATTKVLVYDWALSLACEKKFSELADPKLKGNYVEEELEIVILVGLLCAQSQPENRPTMLEVVELLKVSSKDTLSRLQKNELFRNRPTSENKDGASFGDNNSHFVSKEKEIFEMKQN